jgi:hypothetical protein
VSAFALVPVVVTVKFEVAVAPAPIVIVGVGKAIAPEAIAGAAFAGITDNRPKPNADTATSAMRLIDVFVDICFLSLRVEPEAFSDPAWRVRELSSDMSVCSFRVRATFCAS